MTSNNFKAIPRSLLQRETFSTRNKTTFDDFKEKVESKIKGDGIGFTSKRCAVPQRPNRKRPEKQVNDR